MSDEKQYKQWRDEAQADALEDVASMGAGRHRIYTDGLGALGVGTSLTDKYSEGNFKQAVYDMIAVEGRSHVVLDTEVADDER